MKWRRGADVVRDDGKFEEIVSVWNSRGMSILALLTNLGRFNSSGFEGSTWGQKVVKNGKNDKKYQFLEVLYKILTLLWRNWKMTKWQKTLMVEDVLKSRVSVLIPDKGKIINFVKTPKHDEIRYEGRF